MGNILYRTKTGESEVLHAAEGEPVVQALRRAGVPVNSVITMVDGRIISERTAVVEPGTMVECQQVRHYDLAVSRAPRRRVFGAPDPVYTKTVIFDTNGELEWRSEQYDASTFLNYVEQAFVQSVTDQELIRARDRIVIGLSGGRDSVAFLKLLHRTMDQLPPFEMTAVTVVGLPDWEEPATLNTARAVCETLGIDQVFVGSDAIEEVFKLRMPLVEALTEIVASEAAASTMVVGHQVLRRMLEVEAQHRGADAVGFGFNADDLLASLVTWYTSGFRMGDIPLRCIGDLRYIFPLYRVTKKELTLYLELIDPTLNRQGTPGRFTTGPAERSMAYAMADHLLDLWPGFDYYAFDAFQRMQQYMTPMVEETCNICGGIFVAQPGGSILLPGFCDICDFFARRELSTIR